MIKRKCQGIRNFVLCIQTLPILILLGFSFCEIVGMATLPEHHEAQMLTPKTIYLIKNHAWLNTYTVSYHNETFTI